MNSLRTLLAACLVLAALGLSAYYLSSCRDHRGGASASVPTPPAGPEASFIASHGAPTSSAGQVDGTSPASTTPTPASSPHAGVVVTDLKNLPKSDVDPVKDLSDRYTKRDLDLIARLTARSLPVDEKVTSIIAARNRGASHVDLDAMITAAYPGLSNLPVRGEMMRWAQAPADTSVTTGTSPSTNPPAPSQPLMNKPVERTKKPEAYK